MDLCVGHNDSFGHVGHAIGVGRPTWDFHDEKFLIPSGTTYMEG